jgi:septum formation protein
VDISPGNDSFARQSSKFRCFANSGQSHPQDCPVSYPQIILASASAIRRDLLQNAGVGVTALAARIDEETLRASYDAEAIPPRDQAGHLAELKAQKIAIKHPDAIVIGCDQVLDFKGKAMGKPRSAVELRAQLVALRGQTHKLHSAAVVFEAGKPVWRHIGECRLTMRAFSDGYLDAYLARNAEILQTSVGGYLLEAEGVRLFERIEGDYFNVLGLPLIPLLTWLGQRGFIPA